MKKAILLILAVGTLITAQAQETTTGVDPANSEGYKSSVLIVPFKSQLYMSDIDRDISQKSELNFHDIRAKFRAALDQNIYIALKKYYNPQSFYSIPPDSAKEELIYIYNSIGYKYEVMPEEEVVKKENVGTKLLGKFKKKEKEEEPIEAGIQNGQVVSEVDNREKYMNTKISNDQLLPVLDKNYKAKYYIFINQLDIKRSADQRYLATDENLKREIKVHYTIFDANGKEVSSGAIKARFPSTENDIDRIIKNHFPLIAQRIVSNLIGPDQANAQ